MRAIGVKRTKELVEAAVVAHPRRKNPMSGDHCLYTSNNGRSHCIVGQVIVDMGFPPIPSRCVYPFYTTDMAQEWPDVYNAFTPLARMLLDNVQDMFDGSSVNVPTWSDALEVCKSKDWWKR